MEFKLTCGVYLDNVVVSSSFNWIHGGGQGCTVLKPINTALPAILIAQAGINPLDYTRVSDMTISASGLTSTSAGINFTASPKTPSVVSQADRLLFRAGLARVTFSRMSVAFAVQMKGFGF